MSSTADWLERLSRATEYRELEVVFSEIAAAARATTDGQQLAVSIDEAIRRLEQERLRDEDELKSFEQEYDSFKQRQQGVVGWFKRHMPLSDTRRQELAHRGSIADQRAEILADNLIIARAQMTKEQILPSASRRLGLTPAEWTAKLDSSHSVANLTSYLAGVRALTDELARSQLFIDQLSMDVQAFAGADFSQEEDRKRKKSSLAAARGELGVLQSEIDAEQSLRKTAVARLGRLVEEDLLNRDSTYRDLGRRLELLEDACRQGKDLQTTASELHAAFGHLLELEQQLRALPADREQLERSVRQLQDALRAAERDWAEVAGQLKQHADRHDAAARRAEQATGALAAAKRLHDAYLQEHPPLAEADPANHAGASSALDAEYVRLQDELQQAQSQLQAAAAPYATMQQRSDEAQRSTESLQQQLAEAIGKQASLAQQESRLQQEISQAHEPLRPAAERLKALANRFRAALQPLNWKSAIPSLDTFSVRPTQRGLGARADRPSAREQSRDDVDQQTRDMAILTGFIEVLQEQVQALGCDLSGTADARKKSWKRHCQEQLGEPLAEEVCSQPQ